MKNNNRLPAKNGMTTLRDLLVKLPWGSKHAQRSANLAVSKAQWLGLDKTETVQQIFEVALGGFFQENPHILFETWQSVADQISSPLVTLDGLSGFESNFTATN